MTLAQLNSMDRERFVQEIGWVFEHSPWVAERAWSRKPFLSVSALHAAMIAEVEAAHPVAQLALLCAHPDLGTRAKMSSTSTAEQAGVGLDRLTSDELERIQRLNSDYRDKFGFPFLFAVKGATKYDILQALERRLASAPEEERQEALRQVYRIAEFRLRDAVQ